jgi:hypothetical protein
LQPSLKPVRILRKKFWTGIFCQRKYSGKLNEVPGVKILHLSDLHFGTQDDARTWAGQLAEDLSGGLNCKRLDALIVSGDVGTRSGPEEYAAAKMFLDALCAELGPGPEGIVIVPGNHDLNWKQAKKGYSLMDREDYDGDLSKVRHVEVGDEVIRVQNNDDAYRKRFSHFSDFYKKVKGVAYPLEPSRQGVIYHYPDHKLLVLGLNSSRNIDRQFPSEAGIHPHAVGFALDAIRRDADRYGDCLKFAVWHHPLHSPSEDRITDRSFIARLANAGFCAAFHGHIHKTEKNLFAYDVTEDGRKLHIIGAGTFGAPSDEWHPGVPLQYNLLTLEENRLTVATRCRREKNGPWEAHAIWGQGAGKDPASRYVVELPEKQAGTETAAKGEKPAEEMPLEIPSVYRTYILDRCRYMDIDRLREPGSGVRMELPELFVPLYAMPPDRKERAADREDMSLLGEIERSVDIENLMAQYPDLLIKGQPGSGKTTLLKHAAMSMLTDDEWKGLKGWLPVLVILSQLKGFRDRCRNLPANRRQVCR